MISFQLHKGLMNSLSTCRRIFCFFIIILQVSCGSNEKPLFSKLTVEQTGINFANKNEDTDTLNILDYLYYYNGAGVTTGDINNDGLPDIYFASNQGGNKLYLNKGNFHFEDITDKAGVQANAAWTTGVSMADVNGDGLLDIYVCTVANHIPQNIDAGMAHTYFTNSRNQLFINNGNNTFTEQAHQWGLDIQGYNTQAVFFDYDRDGDLDMFLLQHSIHQTDNYADTSIRNKYSMVNGGKLFRNDGDHFTDVTKGSGIISSTLGYGLGVGVADINNDGYDDIYVSNDFHENDYYYVNQGNGTFKEMNREAFGHESKFSMGNDIADINNDGWMDIMTLDMLPTDEKVLKSSQGDESLDNYDLRIGKGYYYQYSRNCLQLNVGRGKRFADIALYSGVAATDWSWSPLIADYDLDGTDDIFISNGIKKRLNDLDYIKFLSGQQIKKQSSNSRGNDKEILEHLPEGAWHNYIFKGMPDLKFEDYSTRWGMQQFNLSQGSAYADLDNDGDLDLITNNMNEPAGIYKNNAREQFPESHYLAIKLSGAKPNSFATGTKVFLFAGNKMFYQQMQPVKGFMSCTEPLLHFGLGNIAEVDSSIIIWPDHTVQKLFHTAANQKLLITQDRSKTFAVNNEYDFINELLQQQTKDPFINISDQTGVTFRHTENTFVDFNRQWLIPHEVSTAGPKVTVGDVNGDGLEDFFVCGAKNQPGELYIQQQDGKFQLANEPDIKIDSACEDVDALFFDADKDGDLDLYVVSGGNEYMDRAEALKDRLYINDGHGNFKKSQTLPALYENKSVVRAADIDGDGDLDLFVGGRVNAQYYGEIPTSYILINDGKGNFSVAPDNVAEGLSKIGMTTDACWTDINKDGQPDLVIVGEWMPVIIYINHHGKLERFHSPLDELSGWWNCIKRADMNGDGYDDLIVGNYGLNSKLQAPPGFPIKMYVADLDKNGTPDQLLCVAKDGKYYPFLSKEDLERQLPYLRKEFLSYGKMAGQTAEQIFGDKLNDAKLFEAETLQSVVLINDKANGFIIKPLPMPLQLAPVFSFYADDFNNDGKKDIFAGGNFYGVTPYEGRYDAMSPVIAYAKDSANFFTKYPLPDSQLIPGEIRDIKLIHINKQPCLILARNNDQLVFLKYQ